MATKVGEVFYDVGANLDKFLSGMKKARKKTDQLNSIFNKSAINISAKAKDYKNSMFKMVAATSALYIAYRRIIKPASDLQEATTKFNTVFASTTKDMSASVDLLVESYAMSTREARQNLASIQDLLVPMGMMPDAAAEMSEKVVKLSADLGSFNNLPTAQVMGDIQSALVGNFETMKKYGVVLNATVIKQEAMARGLFDGRGELDASTKAQVAFKLAMEGSAAAQGDMIRTQDSFANVSKKIGSAIEDLGAEIGSELLPGLVALGNVFISASKDGGIFIETLKFIAKAASAAFKVIASIANISKTKTMQVSMKITADEMAKIEDSMMNIGKHLKERYGSVEEASKSSSKSAQRMAKRFLDYQKQWTDLQEKRVGKENELNKISESIYGKFITKKMEADIAAREKEKAAAQKTATAKTSIDKRYLKARDKFAKEWTKRLAEHGKTEVEILTMQRDEALAGAEKFNFKRAAIAKFYNEEIEKAQFASLAKTATMYIDSFSKIGGAIKDLYSAFGATREQEINDRYDKLTSAEVEYNNFLAEKERERYDGLSDSEKREFDLKVKADKARANQERKKAKELKKLHQEQAIVQKVAALFSIASDAAKGIMSAISSFWITGGQPWVGIIAATAALQAAAVLAAPLPKAKDGIFASTPFIGGEAGPELAFPLASSQGQRAMELFAGKLIGEISARENSSPATTNTVVNEIATVEPTETGVPLHMVVNIGEDKIYDKISDAISNRQIIIDV